MPKVPVIVLLSCLLYDHSARVIMMSKNSCKSVSSYPRGLPSLFVHTRKSCLFSPRSNTRVDPSLSPNTLHSSTFLSSLCLFLSPRLLRSLWCGVLSDSPVGPDDLQVLLRCIDTPLCNHPPWLSLSPIPLHSELTLLVLFLRCFLVPLLPFPLCLSSCSFWQGFASADSPRAESFVCKSQRWIWSRDTRDTKSGSSPVENRLLSMATTSSK